MYGLNVAHQLSCQKAAEAVDDLAASQWMQTVSYIHTLALLPLKRVSLKLTPTDGQRQGYFLPQGKKAKATNFIYCLEAKGKANIFV